MSEQPIEEIISDNLPVAYQGNALDFIRFLRENEMEFIRDNGYWKNKIYYLIKFQNKYMCFIAIKDPDEKDNFWTVWSDDCSSNWHENFPIEKELKETAWEHADVCQNCGSWQRRQEKNNIWKKNLIISAAQPLDLIILTRLICCL